MARVSARVIFVCRVVLGETLSVDWRERGLLGRTLSVAYGDSSPKGRALGKEGKFRPHSSTAGGSQPISGKLSAFAKASPFRERWHGEAVTERVCSRDEPSQSPTATALPKGEPLAEPVGFALIRQRQEEVSR